MKPQRVLPVLLGLLLFSGIRDAGAGSIEELKAREAKVRAVVKRVLPAVVAIISRDPEKGGSGSGVIVSQDGLILTAAHVTEATGSELTVIFPDGTRRDAKALGANRTTDAGMAKLTEPGDYPFVEIGSSDTVRLGDWVIAMGHPGGYSYERQPPVRLGRVWRRDLDGAMFSSCPLIGGDSGGPLFDLEGRVIGINSSIHGNVDMNRHVAVDTLRADWDKLMKGEQWGQPAFNVNEAGRPITGAQFDRESQEGVRILEVFENLPAARAGLKAGDVLVKFGDVEVRTFHALQRQLSNRKPGDRVSVTVERNGETIVAELELGRRPGLEADERPGGPKLPDAWEPKAYFGAVLTADGQPGAVVESVAEGGPAAAAGLQPGDRITAVAGDSVPDPAAAAEKIGGRPPGETLSLTVRRGETERMIDVTLAGRKE